MSVVPALAFENREPDHKVTDIGPVNYDFEQAILGAVLYENEALKHCEGVKPEHFYEPIHGEIWRLICEVTGQGRIADPVLLHDKLLLHPAYEAIGGLRYLANLVDQAPPAALAGDYAKGMIDMAARRGMVALGKSLIADANRVVQGRDAFEIAAEAEQAAAEITRAFAPGEESLIDARSSAEATLGEIEAEAQSGKPRGLLTGLRCIDRRLRGLRPGHLIIIGGRPSMGKTALARQIAKGGSERNPNHLFVFFSQEMARRELDERTLSELSYREDAGFAVAYQDMSGDKLGPMDIGRLRELIWKVPKNFIIDDTARLSVESVARRAWALRRKGKLGAIVIDYLQIMERPEIRGSNDAAVLGHMTAALKRLARTLGCAVIVLSQISRGVEGREDKRPQLSDLRDSGAIEQDANAVLFPFREAYYLERSEPPETSTKHIEWEQELENCRRRMDVICPKNRGGAIGTDRQEYYAEYDAIHDGSWER